MLSWNEIRHRAIAFSREFADASSERGEAQPFWEAFFQVFGMKRRAVAAFEAPVKTLGGDGRIDVFWPGRVLIEHKSSGRDLNKAHSQGMEYVRGLIDSGRQREVPRWLIVSDFQRICLHDLEPEQDPDLPLFKRIPPTIEFPLADLHKHVRRFAFIPGYTQHKLNPEDPANMDATLIMAGIHDALAKGGFRGHDLRVLLVRILFCLFADDTGVFNTQDFRMFLENRTAPDGSDTGPKLAHLFEVLNTPDGATQGTSNERQANLDEDLAAFPYVNGDLFAERISFAAFNSVTRGELLKACSFEWARISPAVFGSLFQGVMDSKERREKGAHYTSEKNILKLIRPLFLDGLREEFEAAKADRSTRRTARLEGLQQKMSQMKFLDPACGCGNFLVITYRELRALELEILLELHSGQQQFETDDVYKLSMIDVDQMYGIELEEFPSRIAEVALWLADHQANIALSQAFGQFFRRIPLRKSPHIVCGNALRIDWKDVLPPERCSYVLGNPPFIGSKILSREQRDDMTFVWGRVKGSGVLDYVTAWHRKAAEYAQPQKNGRPGIVSAFVSTNSISQGEQPGILWGELFGKWKMSIHFAHRTFVWESEARGKAHVHCVIIGFAPFKAVTRPLYDYDHGDGDATVSNVANISPYLIDGSDFALLNITKPVCEVPPIAIGNKPIDGGNYLFTDEEKVAFVGAEPASAAWFRKWLGSDEFINGWHRWCLWLGDCPPNVLRSMPQAVARIEAVKNFRLSSPSAPTVKLAATPTRFHVENFPKGEYLVIPKVSSERRPYIPMGMLGNEVLCSDLVFLMKDATLYHFGVLTSVMHMAWMRQVAGRLKSDYRYSAGLVYNNFPWPDDPGGMLRLRVEHHAQAVLDARAAFPTSTLADLYDPLTMPPALANAHAQLDRTVERCYRKEPFATDRQRVEFLFALYEKITAPLAAAGKPKRGRGG
ncbi:MAG: class I SAM-dependent DNA methyltransferase [Verrucomicrobia bacterium]|nr:class I SAM-dependent DNA methyltransferase [Verrucomicrobiota bacterium]